MRLSIYSLKKVLFDGEAESITCMTKSGEITVLADHEPLITELEGGTIKVVERDTKEHYFPIKSGVLETKRNKTRILAEEIVRS